MWNECDDDNKVGWKVYVLGNCGPHFNLRFSSLLGKAFDRSCSYYVVCESCLHAGMHSFTHPVGLCRLLHAGYNMRTASGAGLRREVT